MNQQTLAVRTRWNEYGEAYAEVHERNRIVYVTQSALAIVISSLRYYEKTLRNVQLEVKELLGHVYFTLNEVLEVYLFCTAMPYENSGIWYVLDEISRYKKTQNGKTLVMLSNGQLLYDDTEFDMFISKMKNASFLKVKRIKHTVFLMSISESLTDAKEDYDTE